MSNPSFRVDVQVTYLPHESAPDDELWGFAYTITITNTGDIAAQLMGRHWVIDDSRGNHQEVKGLGVVGKQPYLQPGESFQYTSALGLRALLAACKAVTFASPMTRLCLKPSYPLLH